MARPSYAEFRAARPAPLTPHQQWLAGRPEVVTELDRLRAAGEPYAHLYEWLKSDPDDAPPFTSNTLRVMMRDDEVWGRILATAERGPA